MIHLSPGYGMTASPCEPPLILTDTEDSDLYEPDPIIVPYLEVLEPVVGPLTRVEVGLVSTETVAWAGLDEAGSVQSGTASLDVDIGDDATSIVLGWHVEVDGR
jgi:hypothetical protein